MAIDVGISTAGSTNSYTTTWDSTLRPTYWPFCYQPAATWCVRTVPYRNQDHPPGTRSACPPGCWTLANPWSTLLRSRNGSRCVRSFLYRNPDHPLGNRSACRPGCWTVANPWLTLPRRRNGSLCVRSVPDRNQDQPPGTRSACRPGRWTLANPWLTLSRGRNGLRPPVLPPTREIRWARHSCHIHILRNRTGTILLSHGHANILTMFNGCPRSLTKWNSSTHENPTRKHSSVHR